MEVLMLDKAVSEGGILTKDPTLSTQKDVLVEIYQAAIARRRG